MRSFKERIQKIRDRLTSRSSSKAQTDKDADPAALAAPAPSPAPAPAHPPVTEPEPEQQTKVVPAVTPEIKPDRNFWKEAFEELRAKDRDLCNRYIEILQSDSNCSASASDADNDTDIEIDFNKLLAFANMWIRALEQKSQWSNNCELVARALGATKDLVSLSPDPYSSVATAGLSILLPLLLNPSLEQKSLLDGLKRLPLLLKRAKIYEKQLQEGVLPLYLAILDFVVRAVYHNNRAFFYEIARDFVRANKWASLVQEIVTRDEDCKGTCSLTNDLSMATNTHVIENKLDHFLAEQKNQKLLDIHKAFSSGYKTQKNINPARAPNTCIWFLSHPTFLDWQASDSPILWVYADPGTGKSTLSKALVDESLLVPSVTMAKICYFFFKDDGRNNYICPALISLLHQLFDQDPRLIEYARKTFDTEKRFQKDPEMLWPIFENVIADPCIGEVVILLDALDECCLKDREQLTEHVREITRNNCNVRFVLTSRPYIQVERSVEGMGEEIIKIAGDSEGTGKLISEEIEQVIRSRMENEIKKRLKLTEEKKELLLQALLAVPNTTYLWVHFIFSELKTWSGGTMEDDLSELIAKLPRSLTEHYNLMLAKSTDQVRARWTLKTVLAAKRPLSIPELKDVRGESRRTDDEFRRLTKDACGMTITFHDNRAYLLHQSVKDFLIESSALDVNESPWSISLQQAELHLANVCAEYWLKYEIRQANWTELRACIWRQSNLLTTFAVYAGNFWLYHVRDAGEENVDPASIDNVILNQERAAFIATILWSTEFGHFYTESEDVSLHLFCHFGLLNSLKRHLEGLGRDNRLEIESTHWKCSSWLPLHVAAYEGRMDIIRLLLGRPKTLEALRVTGSRGETPLHLAVQNGHESIVERILETTQGLETVTIADCDGCTPLHTAALNGYEGIMKHILKTSLGLETGRAVDTHWRTPTHLASRHNDSDAVKLLLSTAQGLETIQMRDNYYQIPLHEAAVRGSKSIVQLLIQTPQGIECIRMLNYNGETPLHLAVIHNNSDIVKLLLSMAEGLETVKIVTKDSETPLHQAALWGHESIIQLLIDTPQGTESINMLNNEGQSPLHMAARTYGDGADLVKLLLSKDQGFETVKIADQRGNTPLHLAADLGYEDIVEVLIETVQGLESTRMLNNKGQTPLEVARSEERYDVVELLENLDRQSDIAAQRLTCT